MSSDNLQRQRDLAYTQARICFFSGKDWHEVKPEIEQAAYLLWLDNGMVEGRELDFWLEAERNYLRRVMNDQEDQ